MLAAFVFMAIYYKLFGLIADVVLLANVVLLTAFLSLVGAALTLPGIAAVVLTVGMAVDANILIYERIREELRNGVSPRAAITAGFDRAFSAIFDSNVTARDRGLGAVAVRRRRGARLRRGAGARHRHLDVHLADGQPRAGPDHLRRQAQGRAPVHLKTRFEVQSMEFFHKVTRFPFMNTRKVWYGLSAVLIVASLALVVVRGLNLGIDFTGGVVVETNFPQAPNIEQLRAALGQGGSRRGAGAGLRQLARHPGAPAARSEREGRADRRADPRGVQERRRRRRSCSAPRWSGRRSARSCSSRARWALVATLVLILIYVLLRFTFKLALGAIFAVLHDPICVVGFFALTQITFDLTAISAILAVIGYSLNDTVIVFDRVRERARNARKLADRAGHRRVHQSDPVANLDDQAGDAAGGGGRC